MLLLLLLFWDYDGTDGSAQRRTTGFQSTKTCERLPALEAASVDDINTYD
jgi:hypothetical protein